MTTPTQDGTSTPPYVPLFATQGGGIATFTGGANGKYVWFSDSPDFMVADGAKIGGEIPEEWGTTPINPAAYSVVEEMLGGGLGEDHRYPYGDSEA